MNLESKEYQRLRASSKVAATDLVVSPRHGLVVLHPQSDPLRDYKAWERSFAHYRSDGMEDLVLPEFHTRKYRKRHDKAIRQNTRFLKELCAQDTSSILLRGGRDEICISLSPEARRMVCSDVRSEVYNPVSIASEQGIIGGMNAHIWNCGGATGQDTAIESLQHMPVTSVVTGMCMFGTNVIGVDQRGEHHPLTNTFHRQPEGSVIEEIVLVNDDFHPYESMMLRNFERQLSLYGALAGGGRPLIRYQSVTEEYVIYGLERHLSGQMTMSALLAYADFVKNRADQIKLLVGDACSRHGLPWDHGRSSLSRLFPVNAGAKEMIDGILDELKPDIPSERSTDSLAVAAPNLVRRCLSKLADSPHAAGLVWKSVGESIKDDPSRAKQRRGDSSLLFLNYLNYAAKVAIAKVESQDGRVCLGHPFHEKAMALAYKNQHADRFGEILCVNWIPPLFAHSSFKQGLYHLEEGREALDALISHGIVESCGMQVAAEVLGLEDLRKTHADAASRIIAGIETEEVA